MTRGYTAWHAIARLVSDITLIIRALRSKRVVPANHRKRDINSKAAKSRLFGPVRENMPGTPYIVRDRVFTK